MSEYNKVKKTCLTCNEEIQDNQSIIYCEIGECFWHKKCLKTKLKEENDDRISAGYNNSSTKCYKSKICECGYLLEKKDRPKRIAKKTIKKVAIGTLIAIAFL